MTESTDFPQTESGTDGDSSANESGFAGQMLSTRERDPETGFVWKDCGDGAFILEYEKDAYAAHIAENGIVAGPPLTKKGWPKEEKPEVMERAQALGLGGNYAFHTYFARAERTGRIKIGKSRHPEGRLNYLSWEQGEPLELLATLRGGWFEWHYLDAFADHNIQGEWFAPHPDILAEIERLRAIKAVLGEVM